MTNKITNKKQLKKKVKHYEINLQSVFTIDEDKAIDNMLDCMLEDAKIRRDEDNGQNDY
jgi:hypothetical protein